MYPDFKELLSVLNAHSVKYLIVGAYAVSVYAQPRATKDLDLWIKPDANNAESVFALRAFGAPLADLKSRDFAERGPFFRMGANRLRWIFSQRFQESNLTRLAAPGCGNRRCSAGSYSEFYFA